MVECFDDPFSERGERMRMGVVGGRDCGLWEGEGAHARKHARTHTGGHLRGH